MPDDSIEAPLLAAAKVYAVAVRTAERAGVSPLQDQEARQAAGDLMRAAEVYRLARGGHGRNPPREETTEAAMIRSALDYVGANLHALVAARRLLDAAAQME